MIAVDAGECTSGRCNEAKPKRSYVSLIVSAILSSPTKKLLLSEIYRWILENFPYFRTQGPGWQNSIRHTLSLCDCFVKSVQQNANGKGYYWEVTPDYVEELQQPRFWRRRRRGFDWDPRDRSGKLTKGTAQREPMKLQRRKSRDLAGCARCLRRFHLDSDLVLHLVKCCSKELNRSASSCFSLACENRTFGCSNCLKRFKRRPYLVRHLTRVHRPTVSSSVDSAIYGRPQNFPRPKQEPGPVDLGCSYCPQSFHCADAKIFHEASYHGAYQGGSDNSGGIPAEELLMLDTSCPPLSSVASRKRARVYDRSYMSLIASAILSSPAKKLLLNEIYAWILEKHPEITCKRNDWRNAVRHTLSMYDCFVKADYYGLGRASHFWSIRPACLADLKRGDLGGVARMTRRSGKKKSMPTPLPVVAESQSPTRSSAICEAEGASFLSCDQPSVNRAVHLREQPEALTSFDSLHGIAVGPSRRIGKGDLLSTSHSTLSQNSFDLASDGLCLQYFAPPDVIYID